MTRARSIDATLLFRVLAGETASPGRKVVNAGPLSASFQDPPDPQTVGRWQTLLTFRDQFIVLVDEFRAARPVNFSLSIRHPSGRKRLGRSYIWPRNPKSAALHLLGDYAVDETARRVTFRHKLLLGRFLLVLTRDPEASVRCLHGWAVEIRVKHRIYLVMHSNRSGRLRPLGPVQTDARFAVVEMQPGGISPSPFETPIFLIGARQLAWSQQLQLTFESPANLVHEPASAKV